MNSRINIFDFDGTITNETWPKFWVWVKRFGYHGEKRNDELEAALALYRSTHEGDSLETFFGFFNDLLVENNAFLTKEELMEGEAYIHYNCIRRFNRFLKRVKGSTLFYRYLWYSFSL